jgi:predicted PurR-regulated permease PerM
MAKKPPSSFTSMQIISSKAQSLWAKARAKVQESQKTSAKQSDLPPPPEQETLQISVSMHTVAMSTITIIAVLLGTWMLFMLQDKLLLLLLSFFLSIIIDTSVRFLERHGIPRSIAVILMYIVFLSLAIFLVVSLVPIVATQLQTLAGFVSTQADAFIASPHIALPFVSDSVNASLTTMVQAALADLDLKNWAGNLFRFSQSLSTAAQTSLGLAVQLAGSVFNFIASLATILVFTFFIQMERERITSFFRYLLPYRYRTYFDEKAEAIYSKMSLWFRGQLILCFSIGTLVFIALTILGMPYALTLALLAGFTEFIPVAGPLIAAIPSVLIALSQFGFVWALIIAVVYYAIQSCENNLLVPLIMKHAVGLSPIVIMFGMLVGISFPDTIHPILGIILAVPITTIIALFIQDIIDARKKRS